MSHHYCNQCGHHHGLGNDWPPCGAYYDSETGFRKCGCRHEQQETK